MYAFIPLDLLPPPPTAPGTDFQDLAAASLGDADAADAALIASLAAASTSLVDDLADIADIGNLIVDAGTSLDAMIADAASDDLLAYLTAAADQDTELESLGADIGSAALSLLPNLLAYLASGILGGLEITISGMISTALYPVWMEIDSVESLLSQITGFYFEPGL